MKRLIIALTLLAFLAAVSFAVAGGDHRSAIDRKWKEAQAWQKRQDARIKAMERKAAKGGATLRPDVEEAIPINVACPTCVQYSTAP